MCVSCCSLFTVLLKHICILRKISIFGVQSSPMHICLLHVSAFRLTFTPRPNFSILVTPVHNLSIIKCHRSKLSLKQHMIVFKVYALAHLIDNKRSWKDVVLTFACSPTYSTRNSCFCKRSTCSFHNRVSGEKRSTQARHGRHSFCKSKIKYLITPFNSWYAENRWTVIIIACICAKRRRLLKLHLVTLALVWQWRVQPRDTYAWWPWLIPSVSNDVESCAALGSVDAITPQVDGSHGPIQPFHHNVLLTPTFDCHGLWLQAKVILTPRAQKGTHSWLKCCHGSDPV